MDILKMMCILWILYNFTVMCVLAVDFYSSLLPETICLYFLLRPLHKPKEVHLYKSLSHSEFHHLKPCNKNFNQPCTLEQKRKQFHSFLG